MPYYTDADIDVTLESTIRRCCDYLEQRGWSTHDGLAPPPDEVFDEKADARQAAIAAAVQAMRLACPQFSGAPLATDEQTRATLAGGLASFDGTESDEQVLEFWRALPPWQHAAPQNA